MLTKSRSPVRVKVGPNQLRQGIESVQRDAALERKNLKNDIARLESFIDSSPAVFPIEKRALIKKARLRSASSRAGSLAVRHLVVNGRLKVLQDGSIDIAE